MRLRPRRQQLGQRPWRGPSRERESYLRLDAPRTCSWRGPRPGPRASARGCRTGCGACPRVGRCGDDEHQRDPGPPQMAASQEQPSHSEPSDHRGGRQDAAARRGSGEADPARGAPRALRHRPTKTTQPPTQPSSRSPSLTHRPHPTLAPVRGAASPWEHRGGPVDVHRICTGPDQHLTSCVPSVRLIASQRPTTSSPSAPQ